MRPIAIAVPASLLALRLAAQDFVPPEGADEADRATRIGLYGFGVRGGIDFTDHGRLAVGATLDLGQLLTTRLRLRPSGEMSIFNGPNTYVGSLEAAYHFTADDAPARPYAGLGLGLAGGQECSADPGCPGLWLNVVLGFELRLRSTFNWLVEYHGMDLLRENRVHVGLTTRRGG